MNRKECGYTRKAFLKSMGALSLAAGLGGCLSKQRKKNIVLVTMDTLRKDHLGCYGYKLPTSPNLDAFAQESLVFEDCYSTINSTLPSHTSILTGLHVYNHGASLLRPFHPEIPTLHPEITTLADILSEQGYNTAAVTSVGFMNENTIGNGFQTFYAPKEKIERPAENTTNIAIEVLELLRSENENFFLWLHYWDPHYAYSPPDNYDEMFLKEEVSKERLEFIIERYEECKTNNKDHKLTIEEMALKMKLTQEERKAMISMYDEEIAYMDHHIGRFIHALKRNNFYDNSIIVFTADHGESLFENDSDWLGHLFIYEPVVRIPLIMRNPGVQSRRIEGLVQSTDIAPTLLNWLGLEIPQMDGKDMDPLISSNKPIREEILLVEAGGGFIGILRGRYKMRSFNQRERLRLCPQSWKEEVQELPRIHFDPQPPQIFDYDETKGLIIYSWQYPTECGGEIDSFVREAGSETPTGQQHIISIEEVDSKTTRTINPIFIIKREWERESLFTPKSFCRIVGKDKNGRTIASSDVVQISLDSSLEAKTELYDLSTDPNERHNLAQKEPEIVSSLELRLKNFGSDHLDMIENGPRILRGKTYVPAKMPEEDVERLKALGYVH